MSWFISLSLILLSDLSNLSWLRFSSVHACEHSNRGIIWGHWDSISLVFTSSLSLACLCLSIPLSIATNEFTFTFWGIMQEVDYWLILTLNTFHCSLSLCSSRFCTPLWFHFLWVRRQNTDCIVFLKILLTGEDSVEYSLLIDFVFWLV